MGTGDERSRAYLQPFLLRFSITTQAKLSELHWLHRWSFRPLTGLMSFADSNFSSLNKSKSMLRSIRGLAFTLLSPIR